ncbi:MAG TPA: Crp/Fnr family transcriptional regulator [Polyangiaceae bacterium]|nr:Crp/Fnr family transcriptional regulator [Polyangiaceae bacterium]
MTSATIKQLLARTPVLEKCTEDVLETLAAHASSREHSRGDVLWQVGAEPTALVVVSKGLIKMTRVGGVGRRSLCGCFGPPQSIGDGVLVRGSPYPAQAAVATPRAATIWVPRGLFLEAMQRCPELGVSMCRHLQGKLMALHDKIEVLSSGDVEARLATALLKLADQYGDDFIDGSHLVPVALSRRELADWVSTSVETAVRVMTRWERLGVVTTTRQGFLIRSLEELKRARGDVAGESISPLAE